jgi:hypothetical protein
MTAVKQYTLQNFINHANNNYDAQFSSIADLSTYVFEKISHMNGAQEGRQADMLLVGHYYHKSGGPSIWAHANGYDVWYYYSQSAEVCELVPEAQKARMYFDPPYSLMGVMQGSTESS